MPTIAPSESVFRTFAPVEGFSYRSSVFAVTIPSCSGLSGGGLGVGVGVGAGVVPGEGCGVCTSSGTVGHSLSLGKADAALIVARDCALADAAATRLGNLVQDPEKLDGPLDEVCAIPGVEGALIIAGDRIGIKGNLVIQSVRGSLNGR